MGQRNTKDKAENAQSEFNPNYAPLKLFDNESNEWRVAAASDAEQAEHQQSCEELRLLTFNVWFSHHQERVRWAAILGEVERIKPHVICFQEVEMPLLSHLKEHEMIREHYMLMDIRNDLVASRYACMILVQRPQGSDGWGGAFTSIESVSIIPMQSVYTRKLVLLQGKVGELGLRVGTVHLDSGKPNHESRLAQLTQCYEELQKVEDGFVAHSAVLCGDFNFCPSYPEQGPNISEHPNGKHYHDVWAVLHPDDPGYTEDTEINKMRLEAHPSHKQVRYDRVILRNLPVTGEEVDAEGDSLSVLNAAGKGLAPIHIEVLGKDPIPDALDAKGIPVWPSDHFGLAATFRVHNHRE